MLTSGATMVDGLRVEGWMGWMGWTVRRAGIGWSMGVQGGSLVLGAGVPDRVPGGWSCTGAANSVWALWALSGAGQVRGGAILAIPRYHTSHLGLPVYFCRPMQLH
jgi:hypothetical protein